MSNPTLRTGKVTATNDGPTSRRLAPDERSLDRPHRPPWRQRLVEAERGISHSFRADSALYLHLFLDSLLLATCGVFGLSATHWVIVVVSLTVMLSAELFAQSMQVAVQELSSHNRKHVISLAAAAKLLAVLGSTSAIGIVLWLRFRELFWL